MKFKVKTELDLNDFRNSQVLNLENQMANLLKQEKELLSKIRKTCKHNHVAQCDYEPMEYFLCLRPVRLCLNCGVEEEGWGCGYKILTDPTEYNVSKCDNPKRKFYTVERNDLYQLRYNTGLCRIGNK